MPNWKALEGRLSDALALPRRPVAVAFLDAVPADVPRFVGSEPSGCSFWALAARGRAFYTEPADHHNCPIGSYTHNIPLPPDRAHELGDTLNLMTQTGYLRPEDVPGIPRLGATPAAVVYAPLGDTPVDPDVVVVAGRPGTLMLLYEAAQRAGVPASTWLGRPTCMALPAVTGGGVAASVGCVGNRVYTGIGDDELYVTLAGRELEPVVEALSVVAAANTRLAEYHGARRDALRSERAHR